MDHCNGAMMSSKAWWTPSPTLVPSSCWPGRYHDNGDNNNDDDDDGDDNDDDPAPDLPPDSFNGLLFVIAKPLNLYLWTNVIHSHLYTLYYHHCHHWKTPSTYINDSVSFTLDCHHCQAFQVVSFTCAHIGLPSLPSKSHLFDTFAKDRVPLWNLPRGRCCPETLVIHLESFSSSSIRSMSPSLPF